MNPLDILKLLGQPQEAKAIAPPLVPLPDQPKGAKELIEMAIQLHKQKREEAQEEEEREYEDLIKEDKPYQERE